MKIDVDTFKQQAQDFLLRLFVENSSGSTLSNPGSRFYTGAHCGTFSRTRQ
jgi:hypothetical protein